MTPDPPSLGWRASLAILARLPQGLLSRGAGAIARIPLPPAVRRPVIGGFARLAGIDVGEALRPLEAYRTVDEFFVRRLRPGARSFPSNPSTVASPVDGIIGCTGRVEAGSALQAKGRSYVVADLLRDGHRAAAFEGGIFITIYLSPRHYHRIHTPLPARVAAARHVPGRLFPVNRPAVQWVDRLFVVNERLIAHLDTDLGPVALVAVGAYNVGRISAAFDSTWGGADGSAITNRGSPPPPRRTYDPPIQLESGDEIMAFHLGSTVVLLLPPGPKLEPDLIAGCEVRAGDPIARL